MYDIGAQFRKRKMINDRSLVNEPNSSRMVEGCEAMEVFFSKLMLQ